MNWGKPVAVLAAGAVVTTLAGCGVVDRESFTDGQPVPEQVTAVRFDVPAGKVKVRVQDGAPVSFRRDVHFRGNRPGSSHRVDGETLVLEGCGDDCSVDYDVVLPRGMAVGGHAGAGDVEVDGASNVDVELAAGTFTGRGVDGPVKVKALAGDIDLSVRSPQNVELDSAAGTVQVTVPRSAYRFRAESAAGKVDSAVADDPAGAHELNLRAAAGDVTVRTA